MIVTSLVLLLQPAAVGRSTDAAIALRGEPGLSGPTGATGTYTVSAAGGLARGGAGLTLRACASGELLVSNGAGWSCATAAAAALGAGDGVSVSGSTVSMSGALGKSL